MRRAAPRAGLPAHVLGDEGAEWLVWRGGDETLLGYPLPVSQCRLPGARTALAVRGARREEVASFPEARWENRTELY